jgi:hypothetical protein
MSIPKLYLFGFVSILEFLSTNSIVMVLDYGIYNDRSE